MSNRDRYLLLRALHIRHLLGWGVVVMLVLLLVAVGATRATKAPHIPTGATTALHRALRQGETDAWHALLNVSS